MKHHTYRASLGWLNEVAKGKRRILALLILLQCVLGFSAVGYALFLQGIVDAAVSGDRGGLITSSLLLVSLLLFQVLLNGLYRFLEEHTKASLENALKERLFRALLTRDYGAVTNTHSGEWMNRLTSDTVLVSADMTNLLPSLGGMAVRMCAAMVTLLTIEMKFGLLLLVGGGALMLVTLVLRRGLKLFHTRVQAADGVVRVFLSERLGSLMTIRAFGREGTTLDQSRERMNDHKAARMRKINFSNVCNMCMAMAVNGVYAFGAVYCGFRILAGAMSYGTFTAVLQLINQVQNPITNLSGFLPRYYAMLASADRLIEAEQFVEDDRTPAVADVERFYREEFRGLQLKDACFTYRIGRESPQLLNGLDLTIRKGEYVAFTGPSGCGKSTVLKLLMCLYQLDSGERNIMSTNGTRPLTAGWRELFAYVPQGNQLMNGTIREVVTFGDRTAMTRDGDIHRALEIACADKFVDELPDGLDTVLGDQGVRLSGGERQRIVLARVLLGHPRLIIMDEATSAMDYESETAVRQAVRELDKEITVLIIAHRLATVRTAQKAIVLENGTITEDGTLDELIAHPDGYLNKLLYIE
jgi:ATP-binding cassette subfamily B protein